MKNAVISILLAMLICSADFWIFDGVMERVFVTILFSAIIWYGIEEVSGYLHQRRMRVWKIKRIMRRLKEMEIQNRP